jgi:hypothetical protein
MQYCHSDADGCTSELQGHSFGNEEDGTTVSIYCLWESGTVHCDCSAKATLYGGWLLHICSLHLGVYSDRGDCCGIHRTAAAASRWTTAK